MIITSVSESGTVQQIFIENCQRWEISITHIILDGYLTVEFLIFQNAPCRSLLFRHFLRVVHHTGDAPHITCRIIRPWLSTDLIFTEHTINVWRDSIHIVIIFIRGIKKLLRQRLQLIFFHKLHDHVVRRTHQIILISKI